MQRIARLSLIALGVVMTVGTLVALDRPVVSRPTESSIEVASRYQMRSRTPSFYSRSKISYQTSNANRG